MVLDDRCLCSSVSATAYGRHRIVSNLGDPPDQDHLLVTCFFAILRQCPDTDPTLGPPDSASTPPPSIGAYCSCALSIRVARCTGSSPRARWGTSKFLGCERVSLGLRAGPVNGQGRVGREQAGEDPFPISPLQRCQKLSEVLRMTLTITATRMRTPMIMPTGMMTPMDTAGPGSPGVAVGAVSLPTSCRGTQTIESDDFEGIEVDEVGID